MNIHKLIVPAIASVIMFSAGAAFAQTTTTTNGGVIISTTPVSTTITPSAGATLGTITITGDQTGASITSLPISISAGGGASASNLTNCQVFNSNGTALGAGLSPVAGSNSFVLSSPLAVGGTTGTTTLTFRCDVATGTPAGSTFSIVAGNPVLGTGLAINLDTAPSVPAGSAGVALANISVDASRSGSAINLSTVPVNVSAGNGAAMGNLSNCVIRNSVTGLNLSNSLALTGGSQTFSLFAPLNVAGGAATMLSFICDVSTATPVGGTFSIAVAPNAFSATNAATGATITPVPVVGNGANGLPASTSGVVIVSGSTGGTGSTGGSTGGGTTPGIPNTGLGGTAMATFAVLLLSALVALGGTMFLRRVR